MANELEDLVISGKELDKKLVVEVLSPYLRLDKDSCSIRPLEGWNNLSANLKILLYLVARKAMLALSFDLETEGAIASEVINDTGLKKGTAYPALRIMLSDRTINQSKDGRYFIPNFAVERIKTMLDEE